MMKPLKLAVTTIGDRPLRFCLMDGGNKFYTCNDMHMTGCQPLFLGSDILQGLPEWDKNMWRIHARLAKQGLATKLLFRKCRIDGLKKGDEAYFYTVHGLFRAVFEYHSLPVQRHCLQLLTDVWMKVSAESQQQLEAKYEVLRRDLVVDDDCPPPSAADQVDSDSKNHTPAPSSHQKKKMADAGNDLSGQNLSASAGQKSMAVEGRPKEEACKATASAQDSETEIGHPLSLTGAGQETVVVETVCRMCRIRRKMTARQLEDVDSMCQVAKKARHQDCVEGGGDAPQLKVPEGSMVTGTMVTGHVTAAQSMAHVVGEKGNNISVEATSVFRPRLSCVPYLIPVVNSSPFHDLRAVPFNDAQYTNICRGSFQTGGADAEGYVQLWMEEVHKLKQQLASPDVTTWQHGGDEANESVAQAVPASHLQHTQLELMQVVLTFLLHCMRAITTPLEVSLISEILALITNAAENNTESARSAQEWPVSPPLKLFLLSALGTWLGKEFHQFRPAIAQRVTAFKFKHVTNISDLPPPEDLIGQLFPPCMLTFTSAWLGVADARHAADVRQQDHCYASRVTSATQHHNPNQHHALQQLLLELVNDTLVSGIAHVVYCKL